MRAPTSCRSITSASRPREHLGGRLARLAVERVDRHAAARVLARAASRSCCPAGRTRKPCCGPKIAASVTPGRGRGAVDDVAERAVDRRRVADDADAPPSQPAGVEQEVGSRAPLAWTDIIGGSKPRGHGKLRPASFARLVGWPDRPRAVCARARVNIAWSARTLRRRTGPPGRGPPAGAWPTFSGRAGRARSRPGCVRPAPTLAPTNTGPIIESMMRPAAMSWCQVAVERDWNADPLPPTPQRRRARRPTREAWATVSCSRRRPARNASRAARRLRRRTCGAARRARTPRSRGGRRMTCPPPP